jgi:osmotically-inducible protein OsmY
MIRQRIRAATAILHVVPAVVAGSLLGAPAVAQPPADEEIRRAVEDEIRVDTVLPAHAIDVAVEDGTVTLTGTVDSILLEERAGRVARTVAGVSDVVNAVDVQPHWGRTDEAVREDARSALTANPATESFDVSLSVDGGRVTLEGEVDSYRERLLAGKVVKGVRGVRAVENRIEVDYEMQRPADEIRADVVQALRWDTLVDDTLIDVSVDGSEVTLTGTVASAAERTRAELDAFVAGVTSVDVSGLGVAHWSREATVREGKYEAHADDAVTRAVQRVLRSDPQVDASGIEAHVDDGVVTLRGTVASLDAKREAARDVRTVVGVRWVENRLGVRSPWERSAEGLERDVRQALERDPYLEPREIAVSARHGEVSLAGTVDSMFERERATEVASEVLGVEAVDNNLGVDDVAPLIYNPYVDEPALEDDAWYPGAAPYTIRSDARIEKNVRDQLRWSPFVDIGDLSLSVDDGVVTLTGTVDSWSERAAATENAFEGGAVRVENELEVGPSS